MANPNHESDVSMADKTSPQSGKGVTPPSAGSKASLNMKNKSYPGLPGKGGPNRSAGFGKPLKQHPQDKGLG